MLSNQTIKFTCTKDDENFVLLILLIIGGWLSMLTCISGLYANAFSIIVLANKHMRTLSTNVYLIALAIINLLWLILFFLSYALRLTVIVPYYIAENHENLYSTYNEIFQRFSPYIIPLINTLQLCIIYYTVAVSIDRYVYVSTGLNTSRYCTVRNALRVIICLTIFAIIFILPHWFRYRAITRIDAENRTRYRMIYTDIGQRKVFREIIDIYIYFPIVHVIPIITLILTNIFTVRRLLEYRNEHRRLLSVSIRRMATMNPHSICPRRNSHVTMMLIGIVSLFLLCRIPMLINQINEIQTLISNNYVLKSNHYLHCRTQRTFSTIANFLQTINSNGNLIIYLLFCRNFRDTSKDIIDSIRIRANHIFVNRRSRASTHSTDL